MNRSIPMMPDGLVLHPSHLEDMNMGCDYPINKTAAMYFSLIDGKKNLNDISRIIAQKYNQNHENVLQDLKKLSIQLEKHHILNMKMSWRDRILILLISIRHFILPHIAIWRHNPPETKSYAKILLWTCFVISKAFLPVLLIFCVVFTLLGFALGMFWVFTVIYGVIYLSMILSIATHEASHLAYVRWCKGANYGFMVTRGPLAYVVCPKLDDKKSNIMASLIGPGTPVMIAIVVTIFHFLYGSWIDWFIIFIFGIHVLQFIFPNQDIRNVITTLREQNSSVS